MFQPTNQKPGRSWPGQQHRRIQVMSSSLSIPWIVLICLGGSLGTGLVKTRWLNSYKQEKIKAKCCDCVSYLEQDSRWTWWCMYKLNLSPFLCFVLSMFAFSPLVFGFFLWKNFNLNLSSKRKPRENVCWTKVLKAASMREKWESEQYRVSAFDQLSSNLRFSF